MIKKPMHKTVTKKPEAFTLITFRKMEQLPLDYEDMDFTDFPYFF